MPTYLPSLLIEYESKNLPFIIAVCADLSGASAEQRKPLAERKFERLTLEDFDSAMRSVRPSASFSIQNLLSGEQKEATIRFELAFESLADFTPERIINKSEALRRLTRSRDWIMRLAEQRAPNSETLLRYITQFRSGPEPASLLLASFGNWSSDKEIVQMSDRLLAGLSAEDAFSLKLLLQRIPLLASKPDRTLIEEIKAVASTVEEIVADYCRAILLQPSFTRLEATWRGLYNLVRSTSEANNIEVAVLNISAAELKCAFNEPVSTECEQFDKLCMQGFSSRDAMPFSCFLVDHVFSNPNEDLYTLIGLSKMGENARAPILTTVKSSFVGLRDWEQLEDGVRLKDNLEHQNRTWCNEKFAEYLVVAVPSVLLREPNKLAFDSKFESVRDLDGGLWGNCTYVLASWLSGEFAQQGSFQPLPLFLHHEWISDLGARQSASESRSGRWLGPTDAHISDDRLSELLMLGYTPLSKRKGSRDAAFFLAQPCGNRPRYTTPKARNESLPFHVTRLGCLLLQSRFEQYCLKIACHWTPESMNADDSTALLNNWISQYMSSPESASDVKARKPLADASIVIGASEGGICTIKITLHLHCDIGNSALTHSSEVVLPLSNYKQSGASRCLH